VTVKKLKEHPDYVKRAFGMVYYGYQGQYEDAIAAFTQCWGNLDQETFIHVLKAGTCEDRVIALFALALGYGTTPQVREQVLAFLQSGEPMERWASALALGELKEEQALPVLVAMLDEFLQMDPLSQEGGQYSFWRIKAVALLGQWGQSKLAPVLRRAVEKAWHLEQQAGDPARRQTWHPYQDELCYALGQLGAYGALTSLPLPAARLRLGMVLVSCGSLQARLQWGDLLTQLQLNARVKEEVGGVLEIRFGLSQEERTSAIEQYANEYFAREE